MCCAKVPIDKRLGELSGTQQPFAKDLYASAMQAGSYTCAGNFMWVSPTGSAMPGVPTSRVSIQKCMDFYFATPAAIPHPIKVAVMTSAA